MIIFEQRFLYPFADSQSISIIEITNFILLSYTSSIHCDSMDINFVS